MSKTVLVACKLPCGLILDGIAGALMLNGMNTAFVPGAPGLTHVDEAEWSYVKTAYAEHSAFKNNAIFATGSDKVADVVDAAEDLKDEKTGLEGLDPTNPAAAIALSKDKLAPENDKNLNKLLAENSGAAPRKGTGSAKNKMAALEAAAAVADKA